MYISYQTAISNINNDDFENAHFMRYAFQDMKAGINSLFFITCN